MQQVVACVVLITKALSHKNVFIFTKATISKTPISITQTNANSFIGLFVLCFSLSYSISFAQQKEIAGQVTNGKQVEGIHIINKTSRYNSITDQEGNFIIKAKPRDTLIISSISYRSKLEIVTKAVYEGARLTILLDELVNELDEVVVGNTLTGNLATDLNSIKTEKIINFDDVGIPGFKGKPEEKIVPVFTGIGTLTSVDIESLYKHLSGYYRKLRLQRKWDNQNEVVIAIMNFYSPRFFEEAYQIPEDRLYDFLLFCVETSSMQKDFTRENFMGVLTTFSENSKVYLQRLGETKQ